MQTNATIGRSAASTADIKAWLAGKAQQFSTWLNSESRFFSNVSGFPVTRITVVKVNAVMALLFFTAFAAVWQPLAAVASAVAAAWLVSTLNDGIGKGGEA